MSIPTVTLERTMAALLGFLLKAEVDAIFKQQPFRPTDTCASPLELWRAGVEARASLAPLPIGVADHDLPGSMTAQAEAIRGRRTYKDFYESVADYRISLVPIECLLAPQWYADLDYVAELANRVPAADDLGALLEYAFTDGELVEPVVTGNQVVFSSHRRDLFCSPVPSLRKVGTGEYEIVARAISRPNYINVAVLNGRLLLTNGVHKVLAAYGAGVRQIPAAVRDVHTLEEAGLNLQTSMFMDQTFKGPRPALVVDFTNPNLAAALVMRGMDQILRLSLGVEVFLSPAVA
jgi:hypothetical protein